MLIYMAVPVSIMVGLCIFSYMLGRYVRIGKRERQIAPPEMPEAPPPAKEPDRAPILEEENRSLKEALEAKNKELEERNKAADLILQANQKLLDEIHQEKINNEAEQEAESEEIIKLKERIEQLEEELAAKNTASRPQKPAKKAKRKSRKKK